MNMFEVVALFSFYGIDSSKKETRYQLFGADFKNNQSELTIKMFIVLEVLFQFYSKIFHKNSGQNSL